MKRISLVLALLIIVIPAIKATAQNPQKCDLKPAQNLIADFKATGDNSQDLAALLKISKTISAANIACSGYALSGKSAKIAGPYDLKEGLYLVSIRSEGGLAMTGKVLDGDCGQGTGSTNAFFEIMTKGRGLMESVVRSGGDCKLLVDIGLTFSPWMLTIEPIE
jgi:hypothetical protein